jgi:pantothenate kinase-related protein Tda10
MIARKWTSRFYDWRNEQNEKIETRISRCMRTEQSETRNARIRERKRFAHFANIYIYTFSLWSMIM